MWNGRYTAEHTHPADPQYTEYYVHDKVTGCKICNCFTQEAAEKIARALNFAGEE